MMPGAPFEYRVRRPPRARRVRVSVDGAGDVEVVLPRRAPEREAARAGRRLEPGIRRRRRTLSRAAAEVARPAGTVPYLGRDLRLVPQPGRERVHRRGDELLVPRRDAAAAIERWYRRQGRGGGAPPPRAARPRRRPPRRHALLRSHDPRAEDPLGVVLEHGPHVVQLAPAARARRRPRLRRRARGLPPRDHGPLPPLLGAARVAGGRLARSRALAAPLRPYARALSRLRAESGLASVGCGGRPARRERRR